MDGEPPAGTKLPPERRLANLLGVNRTTIVNAYRELAADGLVSGQVGRGTIVIYGAREDAAAVDVTTWPRVNGYQATRTLTRDPQTKSIPVVMITTKDQETDRIWGMRQGAVDYLVKPVTEAVLVAKAQEVLERGSND